MPAIGEGEQERGKIDAFSFSPGELHVTAEALRLLRAKLRAAGDPYALRVGGLVAKVKSAAEYWRGFMGHLRILDEAGNTPDTIRC